MTALAPDDITALDACALSDAIHARRISCREVMQATLARIHRLNPTYNALVNLRPDDELLAEAEACDAELARGKSGQGSRGWKAWAAPSRPRGWACRPPACGTPG